MQAEDSSLRIVCPSNACLFDMMYELRRELPLGTKRSGRVNERTNEACFEATLMRYAVRFIQDKPRKGNANVSTHTK